MNDLFKHYLIISMLVSLLPFFGEDQVTAASVKSPILNAKSAVIMDMDTGKVMFGKKQYVKRNQASLTKLMTVTLAMEANKPLSKVKISKKVSQVKYSRFPLLKGDVYYVRDLAYGAMLPSSNGCCTALALKTDPAPGKFARRMNRQAKKLGCKYTHYINSHGYPDSRHYTCAYDSALVLRYAYNNELVRTYMSTKKWRFKTLKKKKVIKLTNTNELLGTYKGVICGKTGTSKMAGYCMATVYNYKNKNYAVVVLGCSDEIKRLEDNKKLYKYIRKRVAARR